MSTTQYLTPMEVQQMLGIKEKTLANWRNQGRGPQFYKIGGKVIRYAMLDLEKWIQSQRIRTVDSIESQSRIQLVS